MTEDSKFSASLKSPVQWVITLLLILFLLAIAFGPIFSSNASHGHGHNPVMQNVRQIGQVLFSYAQDHNGTYPTGTSSTEIFQKLIDSGYVTDSSLFWEGMLKVPRKIKSTSTILKPENVCFDVTIPADFTSSDSLPLVFVTGYRIDYVPNGNATPLFSWAKDWTGLAVFYKGNNAIFLKSLGRSDGVVTHFTPQDFDPAGKKYVQLTPDGPLTP
jgi:hypothetical protein